MREVSELYGARYTAFVSVVRYAATKLLSPLSPMSCQGIDQSNPPS